MRGLHALQSCLARLLLLAALLGAAPAFANEHGGPSGPEPMKFTVNVGDQQAGMKFLQVEMVFEFADPEAGHKLAELKPKVQHRIILLLSSEPLASLQTTKGKISLAERIVEEVNHVLDETPKTGVKEVLFTNFIIQ